MPDLSVSGSAVMKRSAYLLLILHLREYFMAWNVVLAEYVIHIFDLVVCDLLHTLMRVFRHRRRRQPLIELLERLDRPLPMKRTPNRLLTPRRIIIYLLRVILILLLEYSLPLISPRIDGGNKTWVILLFFWCAGEGEIWFGGPFEQVFWSYV